MVQARDLRASLPPRPSVATAPQPRARRGRVVVGLCGLLLLSLAAGLLVLRSEPDKAVLAAQAAATKGDAATTTTAVATDGPAGPTTTVVAGPPVSAPGTEPGAPAPSVPADPAATGGPSAPGPAPGPEPATKAPPAVPVTPPAGAPTPTTVPMAVQLVVDDASDTPTARASGLGWDDSDYAPGYQGPRYWTTTANSKVEDLPFTFSFLVREGEQLQRTVEAWWTVARPGETANRNRAVPFIVRNAKGVELGRVTKDQMVGHATWNPIGRYTFSPGWNTVVISRKTDPALGKDIVADAVRITP